MAHLRFLLLGLLACTLAAAAAPSAVAPETFWASVMQGGRHIGFVRGEFSGSGDKYTFLGNIVVHLPRMQVGQRLEWTFNHSYRPLSFEERTLYYQAGMHVMNTVEGTFDYTAKVVHLHANELNQDEQNDVPIPSGPVIAQFADSVALAHMPLAVGKTVTFTEFSTKSKHFMKKSFHVEATQGAEYKLSIIAGDGSGGTTALFSPASKIHPNGWTSSSLGDSGSGAPMSQEATTRETALQGFEDVAAKMGI